MEISKQDYNRLLKRIETQKKRGDKYKKERDELIKENKKSPDKELQNKLLMLQEENKRLTGAIDSKNNNFTPDVNHIIFNQLYTLLDNYIKKHSTCSENNLKGFFYYKFKKLLTYKDVEWADIFLKRFKPEGKVNKAFIKNRHEDKDFRDIIAELTRIIDLINNIQLFSDLKLYVEVPEGTSKENVHGELSKLLEKKMGLCYNKNTKLYYISDGDGVLVPFEKEGFFLELIQDCFVYAEYHFNEKHEKEIVYKNTSYLSNNIVYSELTNKRGRKIYIDKKYKDL